jgi:hypothetical protein
MCRGAFAPVAYYKIKRLLIQKVGNRKAEYRIAGNRIVRCGQYKWENLVLNLAVTGEHQVYTPVYKHSYVMAMNFSKPL